MILGFLCEGGRSLVDNRALCSFSNRYFYNIYSHTILFVMSNIIPFIFLGFGLYVFIVLSTLFLV